jgi:hypothetical protein
MNVYTQILRELGWPNIILLPQEQYEHVYKCKLDDAWEVSMERHVVVHRSSRGVLKKNLIYHGIAHILFPSRPHWWIECYACRMARGGGTGYWTQSTGHSVSELPSRKRLVSLSRRASARFNKRRRTV